MASTDTLPPAQALPLRRRGYTLEQRFYTDPAIFAHDLAAVHERNWLFVGHVAQIPQTGDWFTVDVGREQLVIARAEDGAVHALFNVCRHRGSRVCLGESGRAKRLVCPYHQWVFATDGALLAARDMPDGFDKTRFGLHRAQVAQVEGLIFVRFAESGPDFAPMAADFARILAHHRLAEARIAHRETHLVQANWKLLAENFLECYHCFGTHPQYCQATFGRMGPNSPEKIERYYRYLAECRERWLAQGIGWDGAVMTPATWHSIQRGPHPEGRRAWSLDGEPVAPLMGVLPDRGTGLVGGLMHPSFWIEGGGDALATTRVLPAGPTTSQVQITWYVHQDAVEGRDYDREQLIAVWKATAEQDMTLATNNQSGVNSSRYEPGPYANEEAGGIGHFLDWYERQWREAEASPPRCAHA